MFWRNLKKYDAMFHTPSQHSVGGVRVRHIEVNTLESCRFIFDSVNNLQVDWNEIDAGAVEADPLDPANWDGE